jgi:hypothetical protein
MARTLGALARYWSLAAVVILPVVEFFTELVTRGFWGSYEIVRAALSIVCIALLVHSWSMQRRYAQDRWRLAFLTLVLCLIALGPVWLGLNVVRYYAHPMNWNNWELWQKTCILQYRVEQLAEVLGVAVALWMIVDLVRWLAKRIRARE